MDKKKIGFWIATALTGVVFFMSGVTNLFIRPPEIVATYEGLGYPLYVMGIIGVFKVAGAIVVVAPKLPRLKEWAFAGMAINMIGATASHILAGDPPGKSVPTVVILLLALSAWALRPDDRKLAGPMF